MKARAVIEAESPKQFIRRHVQDRDRGTPKTLVLARLRALNLDVQNVETKYEGRELWVDIKLPPNTSKGKLSAQFAADAELDPRYITFITPQPYNAPVVCYMFSITR
jgi:hypothetical protein